MNIRRYKWCPSALFLLTFAPGSEAVAQTVEMVGSRALGMGGAFVAVANDSSATWWNPAGLAAGPFVDVSVGWSEGQAGKRDTARRDTAKSFSIGTPPAGLSYYRFRLTDVRPADPIGVGGAGRQDSEVGVSLRSLAVSQFGFTVLHTLVPGVHAGATLKYLRGNLHRGHETGPQPVDALLDRGEALDDGEVEHRMDIDLGVLAVAGPVRIGAVGRHMRAPSFGDGEYMLPRQVRVGVALDVAEAGGVPLTVAVDADARTYLTGAGRRRVVAVGAEQWLPGRRVGVRGGARVNTTGDRAWAGTAGASVAVRSGVYLDAHVVRGGASDERGWGIAARVSY